MDIGTLIKNALSNIGLPIYFLNRVSETEEAAVYNYIETPNGYGDMKESSTKYTVLVNLYCKSKIEDNKKKIKGAMLANGFKKVVIVGTIKETNNIYNTAMQFKIAIINQD